MHFSSDDLEGLRNRLTSRGAQCAGIKPFERNVDTPDGQQLMKALAFAFSPAANPEGLVQMAQHLTPELVLQPRFMQHRNGARRVTECILCAHDPEQYAAKYSEYTGYDCTIVDGHYTVDIDNQARVTVLSPRQVAEVVPGGEAPAVPSMVGFVVAVADLDVVSRVLYEHRVPFQVLGARLVVDAADACGSAVLFEV
jgi:hypothetical protein